MKYHVKYYDERRNLIGGDEWHAPPGTSYLTIGMEVVPPIAGRPDPLTSGFALTDAEAAEVLAGSAQRTQAHTRPGYHPAGEVEPAPGQPIFGSDGRETGAPYVEHAGAAPYPFTSFCRCGRQVTMAGMDEPWQHSD